MVRLEAPFEAPTCTPGYLERFPTPSDPACLDQASGIDVVLDVTTGAFLGWTH